MSHEANIVILRRKEVEKRTGLARSTIYDRIKEASFPSPVNLGGRAVGWLEHEINEWLAQQIRSSRIQNPEIGLPKPDENC